MESAEVENKVRELENRRERMEIMLAYISSQANSFAANAEIARLSRQTELRAVDGYRITLFLRSMMYAEAGIQKHQIYLDLYPSGQSFIIGKGGSSYGTSNYHVGIPEGVKRDELYCYGPHLSGTYGFSINGQSVEVFSFQKRLYGDEGDVIGTVTFDVEVEELRKLALPGEDDIGFLTDSTGVSLVLAQNGAFTDQKVERIIEACGQDGWGRFSEDGFDGVAFLEKVHVGNLELSLAELIPNSSMFRDIYPLVAINIVLITLCFAVCMAAVLLISRHMTRPIRKLDEAIREVAGPKDLSRRVGGKVGYKDRDEVGRLIEETDRMLETMESLFAREKLMAKAQREAEIRMLQAQINPHFLYNTLQSIAALALQNGQDEIFRYLTILGCRMHYSMDLEKTSVELQEEFRYVKSYIDLQNVRFGYTVESVFVLSPEAGHITVPKMILQPLAENAYKHGQICRREGTMLKLTAEVHEGVLEIIMEDNGTGCSQERLNELNRELDAISTQTQKPPGQSGEHIGLGNVLLRLKLFFNGAVSMRLEKAGEKGVRVVLTIEL
jgi:two-component system sensor histidine kinase YesM